MTTGTSLALGYVFISEKSDQQVSQFIDGVNHVGKIAKLADADPALTRETMEHFLSVADLRTSADL